jgi:sulfonate transport system substrate-binding protein
MKKLFSQKKTWFYLPIALYDLWQNFKSKWRWQADKTFTWLFGLSLCLSLSVSACDNNTVNAPPSSGENSDTAAKVVRIGYQKSGVFFLVKNRGGLEKRLAPMNTTVEWKEFTAPTPLVEALGANGIDLGQTGDAGSVNAQAAGIDIVTFANSRPSPKSIAIIVAKDSPIKTVADLKGKKIGFNKGSNAHYLVIEAIAKSGLNYSDFTPVFLQPPEARVAFEQGSIDAWAIWDPFYAAAESESKARTIVNGENLTPFREYYIASRKFADANSETIQQVIAEAQEVGEWAIANPKDVAKLLAPALKQEVSVLELAESRRTRYGATSIQPEAIVEAQKVADIFFDLKLIPKQIDVKDVAWSIPSQPAARSQ